MARKSAQSKIDDVSIVFSCPQCGKQVKVDLRGFEDKGEFVCRLGGHTFWLTDQQRIKIFLEHSARIGKLGP